MIYPQHHLTTGNNVTYRFLFTPHFAVHVTLTQSPEVGIVRVEHFARCVVEAWCGFLFEWNLARIINPTLLAPLSSHFNASSSENENKSKLLHTTKQNCNALIINLHTLILFFSEATPNVVLLQAAFHELCVLLSFPVN